MSNSAAGLLSQFTRAGLPVKIVTRARDVNRMLRDTPGRTPFLMDIKRTPQEEFVFRLGDTADVNVVSIDPGKQQLILSVKEHESFINVAFYDMELKKGGMRKTHVPESKRHFLMGMDECHLFAAPLPTPVTTVQEAHRILKPESIQRQRKGTLKTIRTGEWFLTPVDSLDERRAIEAHVKKFGAIKKSGLGVGLVTRRGRLHMVDERVILGQRNVEHGVRRRDGRTQVVGLSIVEPREYARGTIRHPDHHAVKLKIWHRVTGNTETVGAGSIAQTWID